MNTNGGKGYFYSMGASDAHYNNIKERWQTKDWPRWAYLAYEAGWLDNIPWDWRTT